LQNSKSVSKQITQKNSHYNLGLAYENTGKLNDAIREYTTVIQLDPKYLNARHALGTLYRGLGLYDKAIEEFLKIIELSPNNINARRILVFLCVEGKKDTEMTKYYLKELLRIDPPQAQKDDIKQLVKRLEL
jgi:protein O-mannosyl-transferase